MFYIVDYKPEMQLIQVYDSNDKTIEWITIKSLEENFSRLESDFESRFYTERYGGNLWGNFRHQSLVPFDIFDKSNLDKEPALRKVLSKFDIAYDEEFHGERVTDIVSVYDTFSKAYEGISLLQRLYHNFDSVYDKLDILLLADSVKDFGGFVNNMSLTELDLIALYYREHVKNNNRDNVEYYQNKLLYELNDIGFKEKDGNYIAEYETIEEARYFYSLYRYARTANNPYVIDVQAIFPDDIWLYWNYINGAKAIGCIDNYVIWKPEFYRSMTDLARYKLAQIARR